MIKHSFKITFFLCLFLLTPKSNASFLDKIKSSIEENHQSHRNNAQAINTVINLIESKTLNKKSLNLALEKVDRNSAKRIIAKKLYTHGYYSEADNLAKKITDSVELHRLKTFLEDSGLESSERLIATTINSLNPKGAELVKWTQNKISQGTEKIAKHIKDSIKSDETIVQHYPRH